MQSKLKGFREKLFLIFRNSILQEEEQSSKEDLETALEELKVTEDTAGATSVTSNRSASNKSEFEFVDNFKTPFSLRGQTPVSGRPVMMAPGTEASVTATKDLSDFFEETRRAKDLPVLLGASENVERGEDGIARRCDGVRFEMQCNMQQHCIM